MRSTRPRGFGFVLVLFYHKGNCEVQDRTSSLHKNKTRHAYTCFSLAERQPALFDPLSVLALRASGHPKVSTVSAWLRAGSASACGGSGPPPTSWGVFLSCNTGAVLPTRPAVVRMTRSDIGQRGPFLKTPIVITREQNSPGK